LFGFEMRTVVVGFSLLVVLGGRSAAAEATKPEFEPTSNYTPRDVRGWTVYVNHRLLEDQKELGDRTLELLGVKLYDIVRMAPGPAVEKLRRVPIWVEFAHPGHSCMCYHPLRKWLSENAFNPEKAGSVEIANAAAFLKWTHEQPWMVLHELAHGYHHLFLGGYGNPEIAAMYEKAMDRGAYESVLHWDAKKVRAYAASNPQEYFAELSEAWFGANDFYPFVRAEVVEHDPEAARLLEKLWGG
jgi:hypothetical protein